MSADEGLVLHQLHTEVETELLIVEPGDAKDGLALSPTEWLFDPGEVERYRTGLYGLLGAVRAVEIDPQSRNDRLE